MPKSPAIFRSAERKKEREQIRGTKQQRGYGGEWERISLMVRQQHPVCQLCNDAVSVDVDHVVPFKGLCDPLRTEVSNLRAVCRDCHNQKTRTQNGR